MITYIVYSDYEGNTPVAITTDLKKAEVFMQTRKTETEYDHWIEAIIVNKDLTLL